MKKLIALIIVLALAGSVIAADMCSDTDHGGMRSSDKDALKTKGDVKYGLTTVSDTCTGSKDGVSVASGVWLKEYYCTNDDKRSYESYDCVHLGYAGCEAGRCVDSSSGNVTTPVVVTAPADDHCGNKIVDKAEGENCDPPGGICFGKTTAQYGTCGNDCVCQIAKSAEQPPVVCGDDVLDSGEECEKDDDCGDSFVCSSCKCVKMLTQEEIDAMKQPKAEIEVESTEDIAHEIDDKYSVNVTADVDLSAENFSEAPGIKTTRGISGFFKKIWSWFAGLFS